MTEMKWADKVRKSLHANADSLGNLTVEAFHYLALGAMVGIYFKTKVYVTNILRGGYQRLTGPDNAGAWCA